MVKKRFFGMMALALVLGAFFSGCATNIPVSVIDPARLNMSGIKRIVILPFKASDGSSLQGQTAVEITSFFGQQLGSTGKFELVAPGGDPSSIADAVISGQIVALSVKDGKSERKTQGKDGDGNVVEKTVVTYKRDLNLDFMYSITRTRDNSYIVTNERKTATASAQSEDQSRLTDPSELAKRAVSNALGKIAGDVAPSTHIENRTLATLTKEESKDKALKQQMNDASKQAKAKNYQAAIDMYSSMYAARNIFAAGYNQAVLTEATEGVEAAIESMAALYEKTKNPTAASMLASMRRASSSKQTAEAQTEAQSQTLAQAAIKQASEELLEKLPKSSRISLVDNSRVKTALLDSVIGEIFDNLVAQGITVLDRQNQSVIDLEKQYQLSGEVDDNAAVSIGHALGLTSIVFCSIDGEGSMRQLRVRAVDIETGAIIYTGSIKI